MGENTVLTREIVIWGLAAAAFLVYLHYIRKERPSGGPAPLANMIAQLSGKGRMVLIWSGTNLMDLAMIQCLLGSCRIPCLVTDENISVWKTGPAVWHFNNANLYVPESHLHMVKILLDGYFKKWETPYLKSRTIRCILEFIFLRGFLPGSGSAANSRYYLMNGSSGRKACLDCGRPLADASRYENTNLCVECFERSLGSGDS